MRQAVHATSNQRLSFSVPCFIASHVIFIWVKALLHFNASPIILVPLSSMKLSVFLFFSNWILLSFFISVFLFSFLFITSKIQFTQCTINLQCFTYRFYSFTSNTVTRLSQMIIRLILFDYFHLFPFSSQFKHSEVSVQLIFNASPIALAPESLILFAV